jgi:hypothetical protein
MNNSTDDLISQAQSGQELPDLARLDANERARIQSEQQERQERERIAADEQARIQAPIDAEIARQNDAATRGALVGLGKTALAATGLAMAIPFVSNLAERLGARRSTQPEPAPAAPAPPTFGQP